MREKLYKRILFLMLFLLIFASVSGCRPVTPGIEQKGNTQAKTEVITSPLTGLPVSKATAGSRPIAIMINNLKKALPQYGISDASIVYEALAEGGITRLVAVFEDIDKIDKIGTIRSSRPYYLDIAQGLDAIYIHMGGSTQAYSEIKKRKIDSFDLISGANNGMYWRDKARIRKSGYEHSVFTSGERILKRINDSGIRTERSKNYNDAFNFADKVNADGESAIRISVPFSNYKTGIFNYDAKEGKYLVSQYGSPHMDARVNKQLTFKNIFILHINSFILKGDTSGRLGMDIVGSGEGFYITAGKAYKIQWTKRAHDKPFKFKTPSGDELNVLCGNSYVAIVPLNSVVKVTP